MTCPVESFPTVAEAEAALVERRARASLSGSPSPVERIAYPCPNCGLAHITRDSVTPAPIKAQG